MALSTVPINSSHKIFGAKLRPLYTYSNIAMCKMVYESTRCHDVIITS